PTTSVTRQWPTPSTWRCSSSNSDPPERRAAFKPGGPWIGRKVVRADTADPDGSPGWMTARYSSSRSLSSVRWCLRCWGVMEEQVLRVAFVEACEHSAGIPSQGHGKVVK